MISIVLAVVVCGLGIKAFTPSGIPITRHKKLHGKWAKVLGVGVIVLGLAFLADGAYSIYMLPRIFPRKVTNNAKVAPTASLDSLEWRRFTPNHGDFSVLMPGEPSIERTGPNPAIGKVEGSQYVVEAADCGFIAMYTAFDREPTDPQRELDTAANNLGLVIGGTCRRQVNKTIDGYPARELIVDFDDASVQRVLLILAGNALYQLYVAGPQGIENEEFVAQYFASFRLEPNLFETGSPIKTASP